MDAEKPVYCCKCEYLAIARVDGIPFCAACLEEKVRSGSEREISRHSKPLRIVENPQLGPPDQSHLKY